jgi:hypothetical protein
MDEALAKNPQHRTATMSALAEKIGHAYGLQGSFREWANRPQHLLDEQIKAYLDALPTQAAVMADPFAAGSMRDEPTQAAKTRNMDDAFRQMQPGPGGDVAMGVPGGAPKWLVPAIIGVVFLVVGVVVAVLFLLRRREIPRGTPAAVSAPGSVPSGADQWQPMSVSTRSTQNPSLSQETVVGTQKPLLLMQANSCTMPPHLMFGPPTTVSAYTRVLLRSQKFGAMELQAPCGVSSRN